MTRSITTACAVLVLAGCAGAPAAGTAGHGPVRPAEPGLTETYAAFRAGRIADIAYALEIDLVADSAAFTGRNTITFDWRGGPSDLTLDFAGGEIEALAINGVPVDAAYNGFFLTLPAASLVRGRNRVDVAFTQRFTDSGVGLYRYADPDDGRVYLYSDFEPYDANRAFPLFDQPDLKARFTLAVTAPGDWQVISTHRETAIAAAADGRHTWRFPATPLIPTYIMALHAGPYAVWEDPDFRIPLRLFARRSQAEYVAPDAGMWFDYTRRGFDYFEDYYGVDYPFTKYDQLLVPDFNAGAMENAGAVTFTERTFIQRDGWSGKEEKYLATVILHEMAHMWFGNLVTMRWWNDLWLNETFATFMAYHALESLGIPGGWETFFLDRKYRAYWEDQRSTTHPVEVPIPDTFAASSRFDAISYSKGGSVLRQVEFRLGATIFREGVTRYLERHAFGNTTRQDFVAALSAAAGRDLAAWASEWLGTAGVNTIQARFDCAEGRITTFTLLQSAPPSHPVLREQTVKVGLFRDLGGTVVTDATLPVTYAGTRTPVPAAVGRPCPDIVYPNHDDMGYVLVRLDPRTQTNLPSMIGRIDDSFQRVMFWQTLWDNARFAQIPVTDYLDAVFASAATEDDIDNVDQVYAFVGNAIKALRAMGAPGAAAFTRYRARAEAVTWANVERTRGDLQTMYLDRYLAFASSPAAQAHLVALLEGRASIPGRDFDQDRRWAALKILSGEGHPETQALLAAERARDPSDDGRRGLLAAEAAWPDIEVKRRIIADVANRDSGTPYALQRIAMRSLFPPGQKALREALADEILGIIAANEANPDPAHYSRAVAFVAYLAPTACTHESVARLEAALAEHASSRIAIRDYLTERWEDDMLCVQRAELQALQPAGPAQ
ncbi:MAG: aminopeptidase N [Woeseiaceae bacterium]|nr:aminopeptidase N [Woeseiaceae bacterium]